MDDFARQIGTTHRLPEQLYGANSLSLHHNATGVTIEFNARDALRAWNQENLAPLQVKHAQAWQQSRKQDMERPDFVTFKYDW